jgi:excisionase family DNA binding protein
MSANKYNPFDVIDERLSNIEKSFSIIASFINNLENKEAALLPEEGPDVNFTYDELAKYLKCSKLTVQNYKKNGSLPYLQVGRTVLFQKSSVDAAMSSLTPLKRNKKGESKS